MANVNSVAYTKMVLHAFKYPHCTVRGVLLGKRSNSDDEQQTDSFVDIVDSIPAFHTSLLAPPIETLLLHLDTYCQEAEEEHGELYIAGLYFCSKQIDEKGLDEPWAKVAVDKLGPQPVLLQLDNNKLSLNCKNSCLRVHKYDKTASKWTPAMCTLDDLEDTISLTSMAIQKKLHRTLADFENHLDEPCAFDFYNLELTQKLMMNSTDEDE